jgi:hypothetical protein
MPFSVLFHSDVLYPSCAFCLVIISGIGTVELISFCMGLCPGSWSFLVFKQIFSNPSFQCEK